MTKRQLVKFLEQKQADALEHAEEAYKKAKENHKLQLEDDIKLNQVAQKITTLISQAEDILDEWKHYVESHPELGVSWVNNYYCLKYKLKDLIMVSGVKTAMKHHISDDSLENGQINKRYEQVMNGITRNYINVIANVKQLKNAKLGVQYLSELGFDLTTILEEDENPVTTALSVPVDTSFLFIGR